MAEEREGFLGRWSRLKQSRGADDASPTESESASPKAQPIPSDPTDAEREATADQGSPPPELPPIESLDKDSDYTAFLKEGVPEEVKRLALRKLWRSDPVLANLDGLLEYGEDFSAPWRTGGGVATVYRVGKGMPDLLERLVEQVKQGDAAAQEEEAVSADTLCDSEEAATTSDARESPCTAENQLGQQSGKPSPDA